MDAHNFFFFCKARPCFPTVCQRTKHKKPSMSAWGVPPAGSAWATQVDEEEAANGGELAAPAPAPPPAAPAPSTKFVPRSAAERALGGEAAFPSLGESLAIKETKAEKRRKR
jgi:hypothetical protein